MRWMSYEEGGRSEEMPLCRSNLNAVGWDMGREWNFQVVFFGSFCLTWRIDTKEEMRSLGFEVMGIGGHVRNTDIFLFFLTLSVPQPQMLLSFVSVPSFSLFPCCTSYTWGCPFPSHLRFFSPTPFFLTWLRQFLICCWSVIVIQFYFPILLKVN